MLLVHLSGGAGDARESYGQLVAEPKDRVVRPRGPNALEWKVLPLRELCVEQTPDERNIDLHLVGVHLGTAHAIAWVCLDRDDSPRPFACCLLEARLRIDGAVRVRPTPDSVAVQLPGEQVVGEE